MNKQQAKRLAYVEAARVIRRELDDGDMFDRYSEVEGVTDEDLQRLRNAAVEVADFCEYKGKDGM